MFTREPAAEFAYSILVEAARPSFKLLSRLVPWENGGMPCLNFHVPS